MYILTKAEIQKKFDFSLAVSQIKNAFVSSSNGGANIALVGHIPFPNENGDCHIKSGHILGEPFCFTVSGPPERMMPLALKSFMDCKEL